MLSLRGTKQSLNYYRKRDCRAALAMTIVAFKYDYKQTPDYSRQNFSLQNNEIKICINSIESLSLLISFNSLRSNRKNNIEYSHHFYIDLVQAQVMKGRLLCNRLVIHNNYFISLEIFDEVRRYYLK
jgi:hypothetical protein